MTTTINAVSGTGLTQTVDGSGIVKLQSNGVATNSLAWATFGYISSSMTINSSYNVSSITRSGTGTYTINFATALSDNNYAVAGGASVQHSSSTSAHQVVCFGDRANAWAVRSTTQLVITSYSAASAAYTDPSQLSFVVFGN